MLPGHEQQLSNGGASRKPTANGTTDITCGTNDSDSSLAQIDSQRGGINFDLTTDHPCCVGIASRKTRPVERCASHRLVLKQVEIFKDDRREAPKGCDVDPFFLSQFHGIQHLAPGCLEPAEHLRHKTGIDISTFNGLADRTRDFNMLDELGWCTAPHIKITFGNVIESEI